MSHRCRRGEDGSFGLGLSQENEIIHFYHEENTTVLRIGDRIRAVNDKPLVRERLAALLQREFPNEETVTLHIVRTTGPVQKPDCEAFAALQLRDRYGVEIEEWLSELWTMRTDAVWGTFWTCPILPGTDTVWLGLHLSKLFTEPLLGCMAIRVDSLPVDKLETQWYSLRNEEDLATGSKDIEGEILLTTRKFTSSISVSGPGLFDYDESDEEPYGPIDHATEPLKPIADVPVPVRVSEML